MYLQNICQFHILNICQTQNSKYQLNIIFFSFAIPPLNLISKTAGTTQNLVKSVRLKICGMRGNRKKEKQDWRDKGRRQTWGSMLKMSNEQAKPKTFEKEAFLLKDYIGNFDQTVGGQGSGHCLIG